MKRLLYFFLIIIVSSLYSCYTDDYLGDIDWHKKEETIDSSNIKYNYKTIFNNLYFSNCTGTYISNFYDNEDSIRLNIECEYDKDYYSSKYIVKFVSYEESKYRYQWGPWEKEDVTPYFNKAIKLPKRKGKYVVTIFCEDRYLREDSIIIKVNNQFEMYINI